MLRTLLFSAIIIALAVVLLAVRLLVKKGGTFRIQHVDTSPALRERGIDCVLEQDAATQRRAAKTAHNATQTHE